MNNFFLKCILASAILISAQNTGCSIAGLGIGAIYDNKNPEKHGISVESLNQLDPDTYIEVDLRDRTMVSGRYQNVSYFGIESAAHVLIIQSDGSSISIPFDSIHSVIWISNEKNNHGKIVGFKLGLGIDIVAVFIMLGLSNSNLGM